MTPTAARIWLDPPKFWQATKGLTQQQIDRLFDEVMALAETHDLNRLRRFDFISVGDLPDANKLRSIRHS